MFIAFLTSHLANPSVACRQRVAIGSLMLTLAASLVLAPAALADTGTGSGRYVALGDSYSSGEGALAYDLGTDTSSNRCHRSAHAYARVLPNYASHASDIPSQTDLVACSGAITTNVVGDANGGGQQGNEPLQLSRLGSDVKLVTISIGGNDAGFAPVLAQCVRNAPWDNSCLAQDAKVSSDIKNLAPRLTWVYGLVKRAAPNARILVVGYPHLFPIGGHDGCNHLNRDDQSWMNAKARQLDNVIGDSAKAAGVEYVDMYQAFEGHEVCGDSDPWINDLMIHHLSGVAPSPEPESFHPNQEGNQEFARRVDAYLAQAPSPEPDPQRPPITPPHPPQPPAPPHVFPIYGASVGVRIRTGPGVNGGAVGMRRNGDQVAVECQTNGDAVSGSSIWDRIGPGQYVSDWYVATPGVGVFSPGIPQCPS